MRTSLLRTSLLSFALLTACGVRTGLELHVDAGDAGVRDSTVPPSDMGPPRDGGACTSDFQCDDGLVCNGQELCREGHCVNGTPPNCTDGVSCTLDQCIEGAGCISRPDDAQCPPGLRCAPEAGGCVPNTMRCNSDADCDDHQICNGSETCDPGTGQCFAGPPMFCGDGVSCTDDQCIEGVGCIHAANSAECPLGQICNAMIGCETRTCGSTGACDDGDPCNGNEFCSAEGRCQPGSPLNCSDGNACTMDFCISGRGCVSTTTPEICFDGADNDCNMLIDCMDPACFTMPGCGCMPTAPFEQFCSDGRDDDCNGLPDCADFACSGRPECGFLDGGMTCVPIAPIEVSCNDGRDDDCNGLFDCADFRCFGRPECGGVDGGPPRDGSVCSFPEDCHNGIDDDCNGPADCMDPFCIMTDPSCGMTCVPTSPFERFCGDGRDDDCDGQTDCADRRDCRMSPLCRDGGVPDSGPTSDGGPATMNELGVAQCTNGLDDDRDGRTDCNDPDCRPFGIGAECCNGIDDTGDGNVDEFTCRCFDNSFCPSVGSLDQVCWLTSFSVCAPRCNFVGGNSFCAMNLPATPTCNVTTGECQ